MAEASSNRDIGQPDPPAHEPNEISIRFVLSTVGGLTVLVVAVLFLMFELFLFFASRADRPLAKAASDHQAREQRVEPSLDPAKREQLYEMRAAEDQLLGSYAWTDKAAGRSRIPIDRAIEIVLKQKLPARDAPQENE